MQDATYAFLRSLAVASLVLWAASTPSTAAPGKLTSYGAYLPNPDWTESDPPVPFHATRVITKRNGRPVAGAVLSAYREQPEVYVREYAKPLAEGRSDADGIAWIEALEDRKPSDHWIVRAEGYAPAHHVGMQPPTVTHLTRGVKVSGRFADPEVEVVAFCGCVHGPEVARVKADAQGRFELPALDPETTRLWCRAPRRAARVMTLPILAYDAACKRPTELFTGRTLTGRVVDKQGRGIRGLIVRASGGDPEGHGRFRRSPTVTTNAKGEFTLPGLDGLHARAQVLIAPDGEKRPYVRDIPPVVAPHLHVVLERRGATDESDARGTLVLSGSADRSTHALPSAIAVRADGRVESLSDEPSFENELPPGRWTISAESAFGASTLGQVVVVVTANRTTSRLLDITDNPVVVLDPKHAPPEDASSVKLWTDHEVHDVALDEIEAGKIHAPASGIVRAEAGGVRAQLAATKDGKRMLSFDTSWHAVRFKSSWPVDTVILARGGLPIAHPEPEDGVIRIACGGKLEARLEDEDSRVWRVPLNLQLPYREHVVDVDAVATRPVKLEPLTLGWRMPDGKPVEDVRIETFLADEMTNEITGAESPERDLEGPCRVRLTAPGVQPLEAKVSAGTHEMNWGPCTLEISATDPSGKRVQCVVMVDGELHRDFGDEPFRLRGLTKGSHRVIVTPFDTKTRGVAGELELAGGVTKIDVRFKKAVRFK